MILPLLTYATLTHQQYYLANKRQLGEIQISGLDIGTVTETKLLLTVLDSKSMV